MLLACTVMGHAAAAREEAVAPDPTRASAAGVASPRPDAPPATLTIRKVDCVAPCQVRGRLTLTDQELVFEAGKKNRRAIPFRRIRSVQCYLGLKQDQPIVEPTGGGLLWGFVKHKKAGFVFDFTNERGGTMGLVLQTDPKDGPAIREWLTRFGVPTGEFAPRPAAKTSP